MFVKSFGSAVFGIDANTITTGIITIAKLQSVKIDTNETQYQRVQLKEHIKFYSPTSFTNYNISRFIDTIRCNIINIIDYIPRCRQ